MSASSNNYIFQTYHFYRLWTWTRRVIAIIFFCCGIFLVKNPDFTLAIKVTIITILTLLILIKRKDDIAVDKDYLYLFKRSVIKKLSKTEKYSIMDIMSIRFSGIRSDKWELIDLFNGGSYSGGTYILVEIDLINHSSISKKLSINKKEIKRAIKYIDRLKTKPNIA